MKYTSNSLEQTQKIANDFVSSIKPNLGKAVIVGLYGNLGTGKTTLAQFIAKAFGVEETITSPTFVIEKIYELTEQKFLHLIHIDAYRIEKSDELLRLGWDDIISDPHNFVLIEWPEKVADIMPEHIKIKLSHVSENSREIEFG
jgi:tRNA threonylcarbamoyladenosine biosynthesis protein TsaE